MAKKGNTAEQVKPPKKTGGDFAHGSAKAGLSLIPLVGGSAAELFNLVLAPPLERRRNEWMNSVAERLNDLEAKLDVFDPADLGNNESFVTATLHATRIALQTHHEEKLEALRNAVLNAALPNAPDDELQAVFLSHVEAFTPWHLRILAWIDDPGRWGELHGVKYPGLMAGGISTLLEAAFPDLKNNREFYDQIGKDLHNRGLISTDHFHSTMSESGLYQSRTTPMGKVFLSYVSAPSVE